MEATKLSSAARRLISQMEKNEGFLTAAQGRTHNAALNELLDAVKITHDFRHGQNGYRLLGFKQPVSKHEPKPKHDGVRRFVAGEAWADDYDLD